MESRGLLSTQANSITQKEVTAVPDLQLCFQPKSLDKGVGHMIVSLEP